MGTCFVEWRVLSKGKVGSDSVSSSMALRIHVLLASLVLPSLTNPCPALYLLWLGGASTWQAGISEPKMLGLHLPGARKTQKVGEGCSQLEVELNQSGAGEKGRGRWGPP